VTQLPLNRRDIAGVLDEVPSHGVVGVMGSMALDAGQAVYLLLNTVLITRGLRRPSPWALVAAERNSAGDCHFSKEPMLTTGSFLFHKKLKNHQG
jgi:hypothetical protein